MCIVCGVVVVVVVVCVVCCVLCVGEINIAKHQKKEHKGRNEEVETW